MTVKQFVPAALLAIALMGAPNLSAAPDEPPDARAALYDRLEPLWLQLKNEFRGIRATEGITQGQIEQQISERYEAWGRRRIGVILGSDATADAKRDFSFGVKGFVQIVDRSSRFAVWTHPAVSCDGPDDVLWDLPTVMMFGVLSDWDPTLPLTSAVIAYAREYNMRMVDLMDFSPDDCKVIEVMPVPRSYSCDLALGDERKSRRDK